MTFDLVLWDVAEGGESSGWGRRMDEREERGEGRPPSGAMSAWAEWFATRPDLTSVVEDQPEDAADAGFAYLTFGRVLDDEQIAAVEAAGRRLGIRCIWPAAET